MGRMYLKGLYAGCFRLTLKVNQALKGESVKRIGKSVPCAKVL